MERRGVILLAAGVASVWLAAAAAPLIFVSWALAGVGLAFLAREPEHRGPARGGLGALALAVVLSLLGAGVTLGARGGTIAWTPTLDPTSILVSSGIVAAFWGAGVFILLHERARRERLALVGAILVAIGLVALVSHELWRAGIVRAPIAVGGGLGTIMVVGALILFASFGRVLVRAFRRTSPA